MIGLGFMFLSCFLGKCRPCLGFAWHLALSGLLSYILQTDAHVPLGIDANHLIAGAAVHLVLGALIGFLCCSNCAACSSECPIAKKKHH